MRELASELERKKKLRKKEERRETRERKKIGNPCIMREEKEVFFSFFFKLQATIRSQK